MKKLTVIFWDVQHGAATYIKTPNGKHIMIDLGSGSYSGMNEDFSPIKHLMSKSSFNKLDYLIITHPHKDHIDDIINLKDKNFRPKIFRRPRHLDTKVIANASSDFGNFKEKFLIYQDFDNTYRNPRFCNNGGINIKFFTPKSCPQSNINDHSIVCVVEFAGYKIVIPGDNEKCSLNELLKNSTFRKKIKNADILLAPHHGRKSGYNERFVSLVNPRLTVISDTKHLNEEIETKYISKSRGIDINDKRKLRPLKNKKCVSTNNHGAIRVSSIRLKYGFCSYYFKREKIC